MILAAMLKRQRMRSRETIRQGDVELPNAIHAGTSSGNLGSIRRWKIVNSRQLALTAAGRAGSNVVLSPSRRPDWGVAEKLEELLPDVGGSDRIFVDIPIGLPAGKEGRDCDKEARFKLGRKRGSSVFPAPVRAILGARDYEDAKMRSQDACGKKISKQAWEIVSKICEVDELMRRNDKAKHFIREVHPELCFWALNGGRPMENKKKDKSGFHERKSVLSRWLPKADLLVSSVRQQFLVKQVGNDDIVDATAAAVTALADSSILRTVPENPSRDDFGLPVEMVYLDPDLLAKHPPKAVLGN